MTVDAELVARIKELSDRAEIHDCTQRYARGIDRQDRALLRSAYHDGAVDEHVGFIGEVDDFIDWALAYHATQTRYQHYLLNHSADIDGDEARRGHCIVKIRQCRLCSSSSGWSCSSSAC